jgi:peptide/nickel transport system substrate-binding protein
VAVAVLGLVAGCSRAAVDAGRFPASSRDLTVGFGLTTGQSPDLGLRQAIGNIALEGLFSFGRDGRPTPWLAEGWALAPDGMRAQLQLRKGVTFHDGTPVTASVIREALAQQLPQHMGYAFDNIADIRASSDTQVDFTLEQRSSFLLESLGFPVQAPNPTRTGTGPFAVAEQTGNELEMTANPAYYGAKPFLERIHVRSYSSVRSAWADLLRGNLDMLYEVGVDAIDSLEPSSTTKVFPFQRPYAAVVVLNVRKGPLANKAFRRALNAAIDRPALIREALGGRGTPADGPISPNHWAYDATAPTFELGGDSQRGEPDRTAFTMLVVEPSQELLALAIQRQLQDAGVSIRLEESSLDQMLSRVAKGDFDAILTDAVQGPTVVRPALWWHSRGPLNWGGYKSASVDAALDAINRAPDDAAYRAGVAAFQRAIVDDPPAIFLAWSERARAVSTRFEVPVEPGRDILSTLRLWRPVAPVATN